MSLLLLNSCLEQEAHLHSFVVMVHHIHVLVTPRLDQNISGLTQLIKRTSAIELGPLLSDHERSQLGMQTGLNEHVFWKTGFRGLGIYTQSVFHQKLHYIHQNPVRSGIVEQGSEYVWSSSHLYQLGLSDIEYGIDLRRAIEFYQGLLGQS